MRFLYGKVNISPRSPPRPTIIPQNKLLCVEMLSFKVSSDTKADLIKSQAQRNS